MEQLPSYSEATRPRDWLDTIAPYVHVADYTNLCLVSSRFYARFAWRIWEAPLATLGPDRRCRFWATVLGPAFRVRGATLDLVLTLDLRSLSSPPSFSASVALILATFANLRCLLVDFQGDDIFQQPSSRLSTTSHPLTLLSLAHTTVSLPLHPSWFGPLRCLVYLDLSHGSVSLPNPMSLSPSDLPNIRVLKLAGLHAGVDTIKSLLRCFGHQLWSIDLSFNWPSNILLDILSSLLEEADRIWARPRSDRFFSVEGTLALDVTGSLIKESSFSADFSHPDRYLADPPLYTAEDENDPGLSSHQPRRARLRGTEPIRGDSANDMIAVLASGPDGPTPSLPDTGPLSHIHLNGLEVHSSRVERFILKSRGFLEHFECDWARYLTSGGAWGTNPSHWPELYGFPGAAYIFRPVSASNLRVLKIHHSLVTNVPTLSTSPPRVLENIWRSEAVFYKQNELAYPQLFSPDMNPRLYSLTLSHIPRHSTGVVIDKLTHFLKLAAAQEQNIERARAAASRRGPQVLHGLRHIRLEFEPDRRDEMESFDSGEDVNEAMKAFASFSESPWDEGSVDSPAPDPLASKSSTRGVTTPSEERLTGGPYVDGVADGEYTTCFLTTQDRTLRVWVGSGVVGPTNPPAVNAYMRILAADEHGNFRQGAAKATPCQIAAGAPASSWLFTRAWERILVPSPEDLARRPTRADLRGMKDVLQGIKSFRAETRRKYRAELDEGRGSDTVHHEYWKGRLEIDFPRRWTCSEGDRGQ